MHYAPYKRTLLSNESFIRIWKSFSDLCLFILFKALSQISAQKLEIFFTLELLFRGHVIFYFFIFFALPHSLQGRQKELKNPSEPSFKTFHLSKDWVSSLSLCSNQTYETTKITNWIVQYFRTGDRARTYNIYYLWIIYINAILRSLYFRRISFGI